MRLQAKENLSLTQHVQGRSHWFRRLNDGAQGEQGAEDISRQSSGSLADNEEVPSVEDDFERERKIESLKPFWDDGLSENERAELLKVPLEDVRKVARSVEQGMEQLLEEAFERMKTSGTLKRWTCAICGDSSRVFDVQQEFRDHMREHLRNEGGLTELDWPSEERPQSQQEKDFRNRMAALLDELRQDGQCEEQERSPTGRLPTETQADAANRARTEAIIKALERLSKESKWLEAHCSDPVLEHLIRTLPATRRVSKENYLEPSDLFQLSQEEVLSVFEAVTDRVQEFSMERTEADGNKQEQMDDVDLFEIDQFESQKYLSVSGKWISHLESRKMDSEGQIVVMEESEKKPYCGLVLDWIYGKIVNTAEKSRAGAQATVQGQHLPANYLKKCASEAFSSLAELGRELIALVKWRENARETLRKLLEAMREGDEQPGELISHADELCRAAATRYQRQRRIALGAKKKRLRAEATRLRRELEEVDRQQRAQKAGSMAGHRQEVAHELAGKDNGVSSLAREMEQSLQAEQAYEEGRSTPLNDSSASSAVAGLRSALAECADELERSRVAFSHQESRLLNLCCSDPGQPIGNRVARPLIQRQLERLNAQRAEEAARQAEAEILAEVEQQRTSKNAEIGSRGHTRRRSGKRPTKHHGQEERWSDSGEKEQHSSDSVTEEVPAPVQDAKGKGKAKVPEDTPIVEPSPEPEKLLIGSQAPSASSTPESEWVEVKRPSRKSRIPAAA